VLYQFEPDYMPPPVMNFDRYMADQEGIGKEVEAISKRIKLGEMFGGGWK
jgi:hypothetical protein